MILLLFLAVAWIGFSNVSAFHPAAYSLLYPQHEDDLNLECREREGAAHSVLEAEKPSRVAGFRLMGSFECYRPLFTSAERNPYVDRVLYAESLHAARVARNLARLNGERRLGVIQVVVEGTKDFRLQKTVAALYRVELSQALGAHRVSHELKREDEASISATVLKIVLNPADVEKLTSTVYLRRANIKGESPWELI